MNLHDIVDPERGVDAIEVEQMQQKLEHHSEETNELFNLMAQQIKKRCEERVNMVVIDAQPTPNKFTTNEEESAMSSVGNSPPIDGRFSVLSKMEKMLKT